MCCHPALSPEASVALSLKTIGGFSVREIAHAFLADEATIAQRLVRAKRQIREKRLSLDLPSGFDLSRRLDSVLDVLYLMFNEGYDAHQGEELIRQDLCFEALRLARLVAESSVRLPRVHALVALIALQTARLPARTDGVGDLVLLDQQDRSRWDERLIAHRFPSLRPLNRPAEKFRPSTLKRPSRLLTPAPTRRKRLTGTLCSASTISSCNSSPALWWRSIAAWQSLGFTALTAALLELDRLERRTYTAHLLFATSGPRRVAGRTGALQGGRRRLPRGPRARMATLPSAAFPAARRSTSLTASEANHGAGGPTFG